MSTNMVETLKAYISPDLVSKASAMLGEPENNTANALQQAIPAVLGGLLHSTADTGLFSTVTQAVKDADFGNALSHPATAFAGDAGGGLVEKGKAFLSRLLGNQLPALANTLGSSSGISSTSAGTVLGMAASLVLGFLNKKTTEEGLSATGLAGFLASQKNQILSAAPPALAGVLGLGNITAGTVASNIQNPAMAGNAKTAAAAAAIQAGSSSKWRPLLWLVVLAALVIIAWKACSKKPEPSTTPGSADSSMAGLNTDTLHSPKKDSTTTQLGGLVSLQLPNGTSIRVPELGIEKKLVAFIEDKNKPVDKTTWFSFDRLTFETNSATLKPESQAQLHDMASILKAYPQVQLKLGGYTDNTGNAQGNLKLSGDRANAVLNELVKLGVEKNRLSAEGYGQEHPVADNSTEEGRARNRRIDVRVTRK